MFLSTYSFILLLNFFKNLLFTGDSQVGKIVGFTIMGSRAGNRDTAHRSFRDLQSSKTRFFTVETNFTKNQHKEELTKK